MTMAFSGMDKDERQGSGIDSWEGGSLMCSEIFCAAGHLQKTI
jgi:hypothetical protein